MSLRLRRESLRKSSIGIDSIRKSITNLSEGLVSIGKNSSDLLKETRKSNQLKSKLIRQDGEFFKRRRENALRRQREDELEASTVTGVTKRQGSLVQKSTRGFLGRILDFIGILIVGWALTNLPKIIKAFEKLFGLIKRVVGVFTGFIDGMKNFFTLMGTGIDNFLSAFKKFDFREDDKVIKETFEKTQNNLTALNKDFIEGVNTFLVDKDIQSAGTIASELGIGENTSSAQNDLPKDISKQGSGDESPKDNDLSADMSSDQEESESVEGTTAEVDIERRNIGGPVEAGQITLVGDAAGTDSRSAEIFVPDQDGTIVSNNDVEDIIAGTITTPDSEEITPKDQEDEKDESEDELTSFVNELDTSGSSGGSSSSASVSGTSSGMKLDEEEEADSEDSPVKGIKTTKDDSSIVPMQKTLTTDLRAPKKPRVRIIKNDKNITTPPEISMIGGDGKKIITLNKQSSKKTLIDFQSIVLFA